MMVFLILHTFKIDDKNLSSVARTLSYPFDFTPFYEHPETMERVEALCNHVETTEFHKTVYSFEKVAICPDIARRIFYGGFPYMGDIFKALPDRYGEIFHDRSLHRSIVRYLLKERFHLMDSLGWLETFLNYATEDDTTWIFGQLIKELTPAMLKVFMNEDKPTMNDTLLGMFLDPIDGITDVKELMLRLMIVHLMNIDVNYCSVRFNLLLVRTTGQIGSDRKLNDLNHFLHFAHGVHDSSLGQYITNFVDCLPVISRDTRQYLSTVAASIVELARSSKIDILISQAISILQRVEEFHLPPIVTRPLVELCKNNFQIGLLSHIHIPFSLRSLSDRTALWMKTGPLRISNMREPLVYRNFGSLLVTFITAAFGGLSYLNNLCAFQEDDPVPCFDILFKSAKDCLELWRSKTKLVAKLLPISIWPLLIERGKKIPMKDFFPENVQSWDDWSSSISPHVLLPKLIKSLSFDKYFTPLEMCSLICE